MIRPRREGREWTLPALVGIALAFAPSKGAAQEPGEPIHLQYRAAAGCPDEAGFVGRVRARTPRARMAWPSESARGFVVSVEAGAHARGTITVTNEHGTEGTRALEAATCEEVVDGLALILALAVDPQARTGPAPATPSAPLQLPAAVTPLPPSPTALPPSPAPPTAPTSADASPLSSAPPSVRARDQEAAAPLPSSHRFFVGADFALARGVAPSALFAASPYLGVRALRAPIVDLVFRASFLRADSGLTAVANGQADFTWTVGRLDGCAMFRVGRQLEIGPCARVEAGTLDVAGAKAGEIPQTQDRGWFAAGGIVRVEWTLFGSALFLGGDVGVVGRFIHDSFYFEPDRANAYGVDAAGLEAALGLGARFP